MCHEYQLVTDKWSVVGQYDHQEVSSCDTLTLSIGNLSTGYYTFQCVGGKTMYNAEISGGE